MPERIVFIYLPGETTAVPAGRLSLIEDGTELRASRFSYGKRYLRRPNAVPVDPVSLPLGPLEATENLIPVGGLALFGALRDAEPDAWGRRVIENRLHAPPNGLPESAYLDHAGPHRSGALDVRASPESGMAAGALPSAMDLQHLLDAAARVEAGEQVPAHLEAFFVGAPSVGGARPKAVVTTEGREWIAKFPATGDRFDVPLLEFATLELARRSGLSVPETRLEALADGRHVLLVARFDREVLPAGTGRRHMVSALTLLGLHEQDSPNAAYAEIADAIGRHGTRGRMQPDREELFARMVFNIMVSNDDDHLRNHAFLYEPAGRGWCLSPLYDVVPKPQVATERMLHLAVGAQGRVARLDNALTQSERFGLRARRAAEMIDRIVRAVRPWREVFEAAGLTARDCDAISSAFRRAADIGMRGVEQRL